MIQIKNKVNKTQVFKELTEIGKKRFEFTCEPDEDLKVFLDGAEALFKLLRLPVVSKSLKTKKELTIGEYFSDYKKDSKIYQDYTSEEVNGISDFIHGYIVAKQKL